MTGLPHKHVDARLAAGMALTGVGLFLPIATAMAALFDGLAGIPGTLAVPAVLGGLILIAAGFTLMVLGSKPFDDGTGDGPSIERVEAQPAAPPTGPSGAVVESLPDT
jgi:hypothetical protein